MEGIILIMIINSYNFFLIWKKKQNQNLILMFSQYHYMYFIRSDIFDG